MGIQIGIGSWADDDYAGVLYPRALDKKERLTVYPDFFGHVELNATAHAIQSRERISGWERQTPAGFVFDVRLVRDFSRDPLDAMRRGLMPRFLDGVQPIIAAGKLGVFLLVLEPGFEPRRHRLEEIDPVCEALRPHALAVELRHNAWVDHERHESTREYFLRRELVWVAVDMPRIEDSPIMPPLDEVTNPRLAYLRLHGRNPNWFTAKGAARHDYLYQTGELEGIAERIGRLAAKAADVRVVANNHFRDFAPRTALALKALFKQAAPKPPPKQGELF
ncbi:MAG TPA: DUF72 domain-containing protein [Opitutus sp.]|nr:DUF72 domain-containing protein [Opitutus sp.]